MDLRIHGNEEALVLRDGQVPCLDAFGDPVVELITDDCGAHIADPLLRELAQLLVIGHERDDGLVLEEEVEDVAKLQVLVSEELSNCGFHLRWHGDVDDAVRRQELLLAFDQI